MGAPERTDRRRIFFLIGLNGGGSFDGLRSRRALLCRGTSKKKRPPSPHPLNGRFTHGTGAALRAAPPRQRPAQRRAPLPGLQRIYPLRPQPAADARLPSRLDAVEHLPRRLRRRDHVHPTPHEPVSRADRRFSAEPNSSPCTADRKFKRIVKYGASSSTGPLGARSRTYAFK